MSSKNKEELWSLEKTNCVGAEYQVNYIDYTIMDKLKP